MSRPPGSDRDRRQRRSDERAARIVLPGRYPRNFWIRHPSGGRRPLPVEEQKSRRWWPARRERQSERPRGRPPERRTVDRRRDRPAEPGRYVAPPSRPTGGLPCRGPGRAGTQRDTPEIGWSRPSPAPVRSASTTGGSRRRRDKGGSSPLRSSHPLSSVPEKSGVLPLLSLNGLIPAWTYDRGRGPLSRGRRRLVGRALLLGDHPAAEVPTGRDRAFSALTERTSTLSRAPPIESSYVRLADERLSISSSSGCASIE